MVKVPRGTVSRIGISWYMPPGSGWQQVQHGRDPIAYKGLKPRQRMIKFYVKCTSYIGDEFGEELSSAQFQSRNRLSL